MSKALRYFNQNNLAADTWKSKYALRDLDDNILEDTPDDMHKRMASEFAEASKKYDNWGKKSYLLSDYGQKRGEMTEDKAYNLFKDFKHIIPQGSIMAGLGDNFRYKSLSNCLGSETKVLTRNGFTKIKHLANDSHEIMTKGGKWVEAPFKNYGEQEIVKIHLTRGKSNTKTIKATPDHRWFVNQYGNKYIEKHTEELEIGDKLKLTFGRGRGSLKPSSFGIAHGIVFGDGHTVKGENNSNNITLCEDSRQLGEYFLDDPVSSDENLCKGGSDFYGGIPNHFRDLPKLNENNQYLYGWLAGYFAADGNIDSGGSAFIASSEKENLEFVKDVCGVLGIGCGNIKVDDRISNLTEERHIMYKVCLYTQHLNEEFFILDKHKERYSDNKKSVFRWKVDSIEYTGNKEFVYCAEVPDTQSFVIEGNILTGNCVVLNDVVDSYGGICYTDQQLAQLMKRRCGVGVDISNLRPRGSTTKNAAGTSTGTVSFLKRFSDTTNEVAQEGRRGALMVTLDCRHPDIMEFISSKDAADKVTGANISVKWTEDFIEAAKNREEFTLRWPVEEDPEDADITKTVDAYEAFKQAAMYAHGYDQEAKENATTFGGDPGCMFIDRMIEYSTGCGYPGITVLSTNPCGEIGMHNDCCRLIALNFMSAVEQPFTTNASLNFDTIEKLAYEQQILLDNLVDLEIKHMNRILNKIDADPENEKYKRIEKEAWQNLRENAYKYRRTGGGFTALGDALAAVGVEYGSEHGNEVVDKMMRAKFRGEWNASIDMAIERGPFPEWNPDHDDTMFFNMMEEEFPEIYERNMEHGRRNISLSTVAPTGSVSLLANINGEYGTTSGIEPVFATEENKFWHTRGKKVSNGEDYDYVGDDGNKYKQYKVFHEGFKQYIKERYKIDPQEDITDADLKTFAKQSPYVSAAGLEVEDRIDLQSIVQKYTTHSISSTLNLPQDSEWNRTLNIYQYGYDKGLKGVTIFRNGSKMGILQDDSNDESDGRGEEITYHDAPERPEILDCDVKIVDRDKTWIIAIGLLNNRPYEVFVLDNPDWTFKEYLKQNEGDYGIKKVGSQDYRFVDKLVSQDLEEDALVDENILSYTPSSDVDVLTRFTSQLMRHGVKMDYIVEQVRKADITINDFSKILGDVLAQYTTDDYSVECEDCGSENVKFVEGCYVCQSCGSSRCG